MKKQNDNICNGSYKDPVALGIGQWNYCTSFFIEKYEKLCEKH